MQVEDAAEHGLTSPLFTPRTLQNITEWISKLSKMDNEPKVAKEEIQSEKTSFNVRKVLIETFNLLRNTLEVTHHSQSLSGNNLILVLKLSDLVMPNFFFEFYDFSVDLMNFLVCTTVDRLQRIFDGSILTVFALRSSFAGVVVDEHEYIRPYE